MLRTSMHARTGLNIPGIAQAKEQEEDNYMYGDEIAQDIRESNKKASEEDSE